MAKFTPTISKKVQKFIEAQKMFFVATAPINGRINLSPKGMDSFKVIDEKRVMWLSVTGSGNETAAHVKENSRITIMFCAFEGAPNITRLYGKASEIKPSDANWKEAIANFKELPGTRQIFDIEIESVQTSCGMSIPFYEYQGEREQLNDWAAGKSDEEIKEYWKNKNTTSIDGLPTGI